MFSNKLYSRVFPTLLILTLLILLFGSALPATPAYAAGSIVVNSNSDDTLINLDANATCDLREAIINANADNQSGSTDCAAGNGIDTITFAGNYTITLVNSQLPSVTTTITITGNGAANTIIEASTCNPVTLPGGCTPATYRVFEVGAAGNLTLNSLTVRYGRCNGSCNNQPNSGGGILNEEATLNIINSVIKDNKALDGGGGIFNLGSATTTAYLNVFNTTFLNNSASNSDGGGINNNGFYSDATIVNSTFSGNHTGGGGGGMINNGGVAYIYNSTFSGNFDGFGGGALATWTNTSMTRVYNTILANSTVGTDCYNGAGAGTLAGNNNIVESTTLASLDCGVITTSNADPVLSSLTGSPEYFMIGLTSPARNTGDDAICLAAPVNNNSQNGVTRPAESHCDIGSFEYPYKLFLPLILR